MSANQDFEIETSTEQTYPSVSVMNDVSMSVDAFSHLGVHSATSIPQQPEALVYTQAFPYGNGVSLEFGDWLTNENFGDAMHTWPFIVDEHDMPPSATATNGTTAKPLADFQGSWYTDLEADNPNQFGHITPVPESNEIDDAYRQSLHRRLQVRSVDQSLPSVEYMNLCMKSYFRRFHPIFPVIHAATFAPLRTNSVLLLSICSIGSLLTGHPSAYQRGVQLFERLHKAILAHWEKIITRGPDDALAVTQASLIGQTFGLLSGKAKHLAIVDAFHGTVISLARRNKVFQAQQTPIPDQQDLQQKWKSWVKTEERLRVAMGLRIHDAEIATLLHHETFLPAASRITQATNDVLFAATSAQEWFALFAEQAPQSLTTVRAGTICLPFPQNLSHRLSAIHKSSHFAVYTTLEDICSEIVEARINGNLDTINLECIQDCLISFYEKNLQEPQFEPLRTGSKILWHYLFILLYSDLDFLERSIGRDGSNINNAEMLNAQTWARSYSGQRCVAHAIMIKRNLECFPLNLEPAIHVPKCVFAAVICLFTHVKYGGSQSDESPNFSEFRLFNVAITSLLMDAKGDSSPDVGMGTLYTFVDLLRRVGHWEISRTFASIAEILLQSEPA